MSKKSKSAAAYVKVWNASVFYTAPARDKNIEQRIRTAVSELGGTTSAFKTAGLIKGGVNTFCSGRFPTRKQAEQAAYLLTAAGFHVNEPYIERMHGKARVAAQKDVDGQQEAFIEKAFDEKAFDEFLTETCMEYVAKAVKKALATATENFAAVEKKAVSAACDKFYGVGSEGCPPGIQKAIDKFYGGNRIDELLCDFDYEAAYEKAVDRLLAAQ